jgi:hypothetical protein
MVAIAQTELANIIVRALQAIMDKIANQHDYLTCQCFNLFLYLINIRK